MKRTQADRILAWAMHRGEAGFYHPHFLAPDVCDGGKPILNFQARLLEIRESLAPKYEVVSTGWKNECRVYVIREREVSAPAEPAPEFSAAEDSTASLLSPTETATAPMNAVFGWDA